LARKKSRNLTEAELRFMDVLWDRSTATVGEVAEALPTGLNLAYNTVLTTLSILEEKGYVEHTKAKEGRAFVYRPLIGRDEAGRSAVRYLVSESSPVPPLCRYPDYADSRSTTLGNGPPCDPSDRVDLI
jgi:predicted transcriptional regulator